MAEPEVKMKATAAGQRRWWGEGQAMVVEWVLPLPHGELVLRRTGAIQYEGWHTLVNVGSTKMKGESARAVFQALELQYVE